ncbi:T9SS type A sorting domain-containing protein [Hymenobacter monticola]|uniref:T9SS type A sorting domain-containing protein n=1 Tax=Hymenobacter monticola TaxID=1705399 RepID=A0ABY4BEU7_9BACT|nr:T9SS type A sorting domain-containing protein [Hymenobacter monticola]
MTTSTASLTFTAPASGVADYTVTTTPATTTYTVSSATTALPLVLTGLTAGTPYTVNVTSNCSVGGTSGTVTTTFTTAFPCVTPTYATVPYTQTFESTWVSNCALRDVPSLNWKLTPGATDPDASFRRYDDGAAANWTGGSSNYGYTPAGSNAGGASSNFSARYHSGNVSPVTEFATFDLYANISGGTGTPAVTFDYINTSGTDKIEVLLSTDGGSTFGAPLFTQVTNTAWTTYTVSLPTATATSVIRFRATGDNGSTDIGLDNVNVNYVACAPAAAAAVAAATLTPTTAQVTFTAPSGATSYVVTTSPATTQANATTSPITLTGLTPGTTYTVTLTTNCGTSTSTTSAPVTFTTPFNCVTPTYATVPYTQTFENTWVSNCALRDVPSLNWKLTPGATDPDASFRRYDDGAAANWTGGSSNYGYTPAGSNAGGASSNFSARYHSGNVSPVTEFATFDLYANISGGTGTPAVTFDYINTSGTDKIEVLLSTDGGTTFGAPLFTQVTNTAWTTYTVSLPTATATSVIRFRATGDNGSTDIGLDNVNVRYVTISAAANALAAAGVSVFPNPAHESFTAVVPAVPGAKHVQAELLNALGQVVRTQSAPLPATGARLTVSTADLAAGVYTLRLRAGDATLAKRVVIN